MTDALQQKSERVREIIRAYGSVLIAYSGGVDSTLVALVAHQELGQKALPVIGLSPSLPERERRDAIQVLDDLKIPFRTITTAEDTDPRYAANGSDRCYFCKIELFGRLRDLARAEDWAMVADGIHAGDVDDHRHGIAAAAENGVAHPLLEAGLLKDDVRALARELGLSNWDKPAMACLSSRVPTGTPIQPALLKQIEAAEDVLASLGFRQFRVRHHGELARIELDADDIPRAVEHRRSLIEGIRRVGYRYVTLDLAGFRSMNVL